MTRRHWVAVQILLILVMVIVATRMAGPAKTFSLIGLLLLVAVVAVVSRVHTDRSTRPRR